MITVTGNQKRRTALDLLTPEELRDEEQLFRDYFGPRPECDSGVNLAGDIWDEQQSAWLIRGCIARRFR